MTIYFDPLRVAQAKLFLCGAKQLANVTIKLAHLIPRRHPTAVHDGDINFGKHKIAKTGFAVWAIFPIRHHLSRNNLKPHVLVEQV